MSSRPNRVKRALALLGAAFRWATAHNRPVRAKRVRKGRRRLRSLFPVGFPTTPPTKPPVVPPTPPVLHYPAIIAARTQSQNGPQFGEGECLMRVHDCYGIGALFPSAAAGWTGARMKHPTADPAVIPRGYPVWWTGGSHGFGHVAIAAGNGMCWSSDIRRIGFFDLVPIDEIHAKWGLTLVGWTEDLNGQTVVAVK
jgi:hypothetical protein